jgi:hypothetical protein
MTRWDSALHAFDNYRNTLADTDAHCTQGIASSGSLQLISGRGHQSGSAHSQRVAQCNGTTVGINMLRMVLKPQIGVDKLTF